MSFLDSDRAEIFGDVFGSRAVWRRRDAGAPAINLDGQFYRNWREAFDEFSNAGVGSAAPVFACNASDAAGIVEGDTLEILPSRTATSGTTYWVASGPKTDSSGLLWVALERMTRP